MTRTQIQLPDELYQDAKRLASQREISLAELVRRGLEHMLSVSANLDEATPQHWTLPSPLHLGSKDPFEQDDWRTSVHTERSMIAEKQKPYGSSS